MYNVNDVIGMNFKDEKQSRNRMKIIIICMCRSDDDENDEEEEGVSSPAPGVSADDPASAPSLAIPRPLVSLKFAILCYLSVDLRMGRNA